jgi:anti-sigma-K factor RskA
MKIGARPTLDALCGEYLVGTLRGAARRRFERALQQEPRVAQRLAYWQSVIAPRYTKMIEAQPSSSVWRRLERDLGLSRYRAAWHQRAGFWRGWAVAATAALVLVVGLQAVRQESPAVEIAQLAGKDPAVAQVTARLSRDGATLELHSSRPVIAGPAQSYELWLLTPDGKVLSVAVIGTLDARFEVPASLRTRLRAGGRLAISVEPAGGSPTGRATGPVILIGPIRT